MYELTPEERESDTFLPKLIKSELDNMLGSWRVVKQTPKHRMQFDAGYNSYYAKVCYERTA